MALKRASSRFKTLWFCVGCVLVTTLYAPVVLAQHSLDSHVASPLDDEVPPLILEQRQPKARYAGWLLGAYLVPPAIALGGIAAESGATVIAGGALMWLIPTAVHLFAGEHALAGRTALVLAFAAGGTLIGGLIGVGVGALIPEDQWTREEDPGLHRVIGLIVGGLIGCAVGAWTWAVLDISDAFTRDAERRTQARRAASTLTFGVVPLPRGVSASLVATF